MRWALFEKSGVTIAVALEKVLHVLTAPPVFAMPLLKPVFAGGFVYQGQVVPLLREKPGTDSIDTGQDAAFVLVCEAEFGLLGIPADRIIRITKSAGQTPGEDTARMSGNEENDINNCEYRQLDLNQVLEDPDFSIPGLKD